MQLVIEGLSKTYPNGVAALQNVNLTVSPGMFGLLGPNGAGKSSLMRTLATLQSADAGQVLVAALREVTPPEYQYAIADGFENIVLYENRTKTATVVERNESRCVSPTSQPMAGWIRMESSWTVIPTTMCSISPP